MLMETTRLNQLMALMDGDGPHEPAASSTLDVLAVLYERVLRREGPDEDHFLLSKGHGPQAYFAVLAASGCFPADDWTVHVPGHPDGVGRMLRGALSGTGPVYVRLSERSNRSPAAGPFSATRRGRPSSPLVIAVGPLHDAVLEATVGLDVTVLHLTTVRPFPAEVVASLEAGDVVVVEPYLKGTSSAAVSAALCSRPHRLACLGVGNRELRRYGTPEEHERAHGLDPAGIRRALDEFL
ncbi:MAG TPA: hypothetical protein VFN50_12375 [Acidimicrobiales bacterium]|nr:hypothetical protein [Acidimicrobiales bacterium]